MNNEKILEGTQLGLPPMELAETKKMSDDNFNLMKRNFYPTMHKTVQIILIISFTMGFSYILTWQLLSSENTELVIQATSEITNLTLDTAEAEIIVHFKNKTSNNDMLHKRKRRSVRRTTNENIPNNLSTDEQVKKARDIIMKHDRICNKQNQNEVCKDLVMQLKSIAAASNDDRVKFQRTQDVKPIHKHDSDINRQLLYYINQRPHVPFSKTCLLAHLLERHYPIREVPVEDAVISENKLQDTTVQHRFNFPPSEPQSHLENNPIQQKSHPQDLNIILKNMLTPRDENPQTIQCPAGSLPCSSGDVCVSESKWCNGKVDCDDMSDELECDCKSRIHKSRLCDGYFDCPLGEDETGCFGCNENLFSCGDIDNIQQISCFNKEQRCNNIIDCPNRKDELFCNMLAPTIHEEPIFAISNTNGFLLRNFGGKWFPVCDNPQRWAHDACQQETGPLRSRVFIQEVPVPVNQKLSTSFLNMDSNGFMFMTDDCFNSSAIYVTCPNMLCGTRILTKSQLINENIAIEDQLIGRNKRKAMVRREKRDPDYGVRRRRTETRVVGGRPSKPAAWPWIVALYRDGTFHCGGSILTRKWVISAAHCITEFWEHYYEIQVGMLRRFSFSLQEKNHVVTHIVINRHYSQNDMQNDLSLLRVKTPIEFGQWVRPICLPGPNTAGPDWFEGPAPGTMCTAVGWGSMKERGPDPDQLREVEVPIWDKCKHTNDLKGDEICASFEEGGKDSCQGDSGGPLLCRNPMNPQQWYMAGIVSHGDGCGRGREPGVYTRVSHYIRWIHSNLFSKSLPTIKPKSDCPGFKCTSGIKKCIPKRRICDKIIDCLNGEDESGCNYSDKAQEFSIDKLFGVRNNARSFDVVTNTLQTSSEGDSSATITTQMADFKTDEYTTTETNTINDFEITTILTIATTSSSTENLIDNLANASVIESNISDSSESDETFNNVTRQETLLTNDHRGDTQTFTQTLSAESLESMSSTLANDTNNLFSKMHITNPLFNQKNETFGNIVSHSEVTTETSKLEDLSENTLDLFPSQNNSFSEEQIESNNEIMNNISLIENKTNPQNSISTFDDKKEISNKIESMLLSETFTPKIRRKHKTPKEFECRRMFQIISYAERCDHKADCEDGTDELGCSCIDYLTTFNNDLICDGVSDCMDGQDEMDCFTCPDDHFLCRHSKLCIPGNNVCDGASQCPNKEDEADCYALSNGHEMIYDLEHRPELLVSGYLTKKIQNSWNVECEDLLYHKDQKKSANDVCRHLGFSSASSYGVKYISVKEENLKRSVRSIHNTRGDVIPVKFVYKKIENDTPTYLSIIDSNDIGLECKKVPKACMALHVECDHVLITDIELLQELSTGRSMHMNHILPWIAKVFVDGHYKCTGVLLDLSWVLIPHSCLWNAILSSHYITVSLGSHRTHRSTNGPYEQILTVDMKRDLYRSKVVLLHLENPAKYSTMVKPMNIPLDIQYDERTMCVAIGQNENNETIAVFVKENNKDCDIHNRCFNRITNESICPENITSFQEWAGIISCHTKQGWYPAASFIDSRGECGVGELFVATDIGYLINELKDPPGTISSNTVKDQCTGVRCSRGRCLSLHHVCNGINECEDGKDESEAACHMKENICEVNPFFKGCECTTGELKCRNGKCISKDLFKNGVKDCEDGTDEPGESTCFDYLSRVMPSRLCDGILHCKDRSDENPNICKCYAKQFFKCGKLWDDTEYCVSKDVVCDGVQDCPNGNDEETCLAINSPIGETIGTGEIIVNSHGVWHRKCYPKKNHTKTELEKICRQLGFLSGHAKQLDFPKGWSEMSHNSLVLDSFHEIKINENTTISLRNSHKPLANSVFDATIEDCHPLYIECM